MYEINLAISVCLNASTCIIHEDILRNFKVPKPFCHGKMKQNYKIKGEPQTQSSK